MLVLEFLKFCLGAYVLLVFMRLFVVSAQIKELERAKAELERAKERFCNCSQCGEVQKTSLPKKITFARWEQEQESKSKSFQLKDYRE